MSEVMDEVVTFVVRQEHSKDSMRRLWKKNLKLKYWIEALPESKITLFFKSNKRSSKRLYALLAENPEVKKEINAYQVESDLDLIREMTMIQVEIYSLTERLKEQHSALARVKAILEPRGLA